MTINEIINSGVMYELDEEYDIFRDEYQINEGLIKTWPIDKTVSILKSHKIECDIYKDKNVFHVIFHKNMKQSPTQTFALTNNLGWVPSYIYCISDSEIQKKLKFQSDVFSNCYEKYDELMLRFEAKYDERVENIPQFLYHVTSRERAIKILTLGLIPKSHSIASTHPERIYLGYNADDLEQMIRNRPDTWKKSRDSKFTILKIDTQMIPRYFQIYRDPNFTGKGVFTLNTIPKSAIKHLRTFEVI